MISPENLSINAVVTIAPFSTDWLTGEPLPFTGAEKLVITDYDNWPSASAPVIITDMYGRNYQVASDFLTLANTQ